MKKIIAVFAFCSLASVCAMNIKDIKEIINSDLEAQRTQLVPLTRSTMVLPNHLNPTTDPNAINTFQQLQNQESVRDDCKHIAIGTISLMAITTGIPYIFYLIVSASANF